MKKHIKNLALLSIITIGVVAAANKIINVLATMKETLPISNGKFYDWKYGKIFYTKLGKGKPILLIHDLDPSSSSYEWNKVVRKLANNYTVYTIDLLGCGRSDKPNITYTNFLYVQLITDFIRTIIQDKPDVIATGDSLSFAVMACQLNAECFNKLIGITPTDLYELAKAPSKRNSFFKFLFEIPVIGACIYNIAESKNEIIDHMVNEYFYKGHLVSPELINTYHQSAHLDDGKGRYLLASIKNYYTNINIVPALKKINNSVVLIGGKEHPFIADVIEDYKSYNCAIESAFVANTCCFPQLESPERFVELLNILLA